MQPTKSYRIMHSDAAQALSCVSLSNLFEHADLISLSGHKIYAPIGIGILLAKREVQKHLEPIIYGGGQQNGLRSGTVPVPLCAAITEAIHLAETNRASDTELIINKRDDTWNKILKHYPNAQLNGPTLDGARHPGNLNIYLPNIDAKELIMREQPNFQASTGSACNSGIEGESHVLKAIGCDYERNRCSLRISFGKEFSYDEA